MSNDAEISSKVIQVVSEKLGVDSSEIKETSSFVGDLGADSLDTVELVMALEDEFNLDISDEDAEKIQTVQDAVNYIKSKSE